MKTKFFIPIFLIGDIMKNTDIQALLNELKNRLDIQTVLEEMKDVDPLNHHIGSFENVEDYELSQAIEKLMDIYIRKHFKAQYDIELGLEHYNYTLRRNTIAKTIDAIETFILKEYGTHQDWFIKEAYRDIRYWGTPITTDNKMQFGNTGYEHNAYSVAMHLLRFLLVCEGNSYKDSMCKTEKTQFTELPFGNGGQKAICDRFTIKRYKSGKTFIEMNDINDVTLFLKNLDKMRKR